MNYKYIITKQTNPYENLAMEQYLFDYVKENEVILYLWQNDHVIVVGKNQNVFSECKVEQFVKSGGKIARRKSGGGAVYHDLGNLNFSIITTSNQAKEIPYQELIRKALIPFGMESKFNGRNDLIIDGKKFSGNAFYDDGALYCQHGTILIHSDIKKMNDFLTPETSKLERNHVKSVSSRVMNLSDVNPQITVDHMRQSIIKAVKAEPLDIKIDDKKLKMKTDFFSNEEWIYGRQL